MTSQATTEISKTAAEFLSLPSEVLPSAYPVDDDRGEYDHSSAWAALRDAARGDTEILRDMRGVRVTALIDGWRDGVVIAG